MKAPSHQPVLGVQNYLEEAVWCLKPVNEAAVFISSRTDAGVHTLCNSAHLDIQRRGLQSPFKGEELVSALNHALRPQDIRVTGAWRVYSIFSARHRALSRTYVYCLATGTPHHTHSSLTHSKLCWFLPNMELDVCAMREACSLLLGTHDFSTFSALSSDAAFKSPIKTLELAQLQPSVSFAWQHFNRNIQHWEFTFQSRSFLYKQVRRIQGLLEARDSLVFPNNVMAPPHGLFLTRVEYQKSGSQGRPGDVVSREEEEEWAS
ncbi:hypothetical protein ACEWY4_013377 [Coilia grayii]|uniref:tRNA pseudouridine synthase n=1 Tax=Coilia grayii TaxID=363190 RepID=A0ABD1JW77_9TELE